MNLENLGLVELNAQEKQEVEGGVFWIKAALWVAGGLAWDICSNPSASWAALKAGYEKQR